MNVDGSDPTLVFSSKEDLGYPQASPDGSWLICSSPHDGPVKALARDGVVIPLLSQDEAEFVEFATISPDGRWIAFPHRTDRGKNPQIEVRTADGTVHRSSCPL